MAELIYHHYPQSPVSEKVRVAFGIKGLDWRSVEIPRIPPKPDLMPLTGGYRRTPTLQIGADIYCDSQCILMELERRFPQPTFFPRGDAGAVWGLARWTDVCLFPKTVALVLGSAHAAGQLPADFAADRGRLYFGPDWDMDDVAAQLPHVRAQIRAQFAWFESQLNAGNDFLAGDTPGLVDALAYYLVWFVHGRVADGPGFIAQFSALHAWFARIGAMGHGQASDMASGEALTIARDAERETPEGTDADDPQGLKPGMAVGVIPEGDGGDPEVSGTVRFADAH
ncbi:MAG: glutathione S-transferase family protein, partial [Rhodospirillales bacterium]|nr:glutathione S-transferase family protein [Rhodospirillales bacterium]